MQFPKFLFCARTHFQPLLHRWSRTVQRRRICFSLGPQLWWAFTRYDSQSLKRQVGVQPAPCSRIRRGCWRRLLESWAGCRRVSFSVVEVWHEERFGRLTGELSQSFWWTGKHRAAQVEVSLRLFKINILLISYCYDDCDQKWIKQNVK